MRYLRLYYFRDEQGLEVGFVMPGRGDEKKTVKGELAFYPSLAASAAT